MELARGDIVKLHAKSKNGSRTIESHGDLFYVSNITDVVYNTNVRGKAPYAGLVSNKNRTVLWTGLSDNPDFKLKKVKK